MLSVPVQFAGASPGRSNAWHTSAMLTASDVARSAPRKPLFKVLRGDSVPCAQLVHCGCVLRLQSQRLLACVAGQKHSICCQGGVLRFHGAQTLQGTLVIPFAVRSYKLRLLHTGLPISCPPCACMSARLLVLTDSADIDCTHPDCNQALKTTHLRVLNRS